MNRRNILRALGIGTMAGPVVAKELAINLGTGRMVGATAALGHVYETDSGCDGEGPAPSNMSVTKQLKPKVARAMRVINEVVNEAMGAGYEETHWNFDDFYGVIEMRAIRILQLRGIDPRFKPMVRVEYDQAMAPRYLPIRSVSRSYAILKSHEHNAALVKEWRRALRIAARLSGADRDMIEAVVVMFDGRVGGISGSAEDDSPTHHTRRRALHRVLGV